MSLVKQGAEMICPAGQDAVTIIHERSRATSYSVEGVPSRYTTPNGFVEGLIIDRIGIHLYIQAHLAVHQELRMLLSSR